MTDEQKHKAINASITRHWKKLLQDEKRITSYMSERWDDLLVFCLEEFLTKKSLDYQYQVCVINNKLPNYMGRSMSLNLKSKTSPYWSKIRKPLYNSRGTYMTEQGDELGKHDYSEIVDPDLTIEHINPRECMAIALEKLDFYYSALITDYYLNELTYGEINKKYGIPRSAVQKDIKHGVKLMQKHCKHFLPNIK